MVMPLCDSGDLRGLLTKKGKPLSEREAIIIL